MEILIAVVTGFVAGGICAWFAAHWKLKGAGNYSRRDMAEKEQAILVLDKQNAVFSQQAKNLQERGSELNAAVVSLQEEVRGKDQEILGLSKELSARQQLVDNLTEKLVVYRKDVEELQAKMKTEFENIANKILEDRSGKFLENSGAAIASVLNPLKENIGEFKQRIENLYGREMQERSSLKAEIRNLMGLNQQLSADANNLASALKGENKTQGNWGEVQLEKILEKAGLMKNTHYRLQESFDADGGGRLQPDCIINLPGEKHIIIDSKVSLTAFVKYFNAENDDEKKEFLRQHMDSITGHIKELGRKNYQNLYQMNQPDFVFMFIAHESALAVALRDDPNILMQALEKNIVLVTVSTLLASLRTVAYIWKQENQKRHVLEIAKQGGALYDKFVAFVDDLKKVGASIELAREAHEAAMNKLTVSVKKGDTLVGRAQRIKQLGAQTTKAIAPDVLEKADLENEIAVTDQEQ